MNCCRDSNSQGAVTDVNATLKQNLDIICSKVLPEFTERYVEIIAELDIFSKKGNLYFLTQVLYEDENRQQFYPQSPLKARNVPQHAT